MVLQESGELYLETIYVLSQKSSSVRAIDIGEYMGYSKPSVSRALGLLKDEGMVIKGEDDCRIEHYISDTTFNAVKSHMIKYSS